MRVMDLTERIEKEIPREQALDWDNVGLLVGDKEQEIHKVYVATRDRLWGRYDPDPPSADLWRHQACECR